MTAALRMLGACGLVAAVAWLLPHHAASTPQDRAAAGAPAPASALRVTAPPAPHTAAVSAPPRSLPALQAPPPRVSRTTTVQVRVCLADDVHGVPVPEPELLRLDARGVAWPVRALGKPPVHPALSIDAGAAWPVRHRIGTFEVTAPGRYVAAWHLWRRVPRTATWRACRGRGPALDVDGHGGAAELVVTVGAAQLVMDPALDAPGRGTTTTLTAKDGD